jgi:broad specificity phosphatase PhoE
MNDTPESPSTRLVLIRHGETDWNLEGRYQGQADPPLNQRGIAQAEQLAEALVETNLALLYTSPLQRAAQTAQIIAQRLAIPIYPEPRLMEIHLGEWQTHLRTDIEKRYPSLFHLWQTQPWTVAPPGGERLQQVQQRVYAAIDDLLKRHPHCTIGIVTHRIPIVMLKIRYQNLGAESIRTLHIPNTFFEVIEVDHRQSS